MDEESDAVFSDPQTMWRLAEEYWDAKAVLYDDVTEDGKPAAVYTLEQLWDMGFTVAAHQLGKCWRDGLGVMPDDERAEMWFQRSAEAGNDFSQYALGKLYLAGQDVQQDLEMAWGWFYRSAAQGNEHAQFFLEHFDQQRKPSVLLSTTRLLYQRSSS